MLPGMDVILSQKAVYTAFHCNGLMRNMIYENLCLLGYKVR
jgi:hypothetical protein